MFSALQANLRFKKKWPFAGLWCNAFYCHASDSDEPRVSCNSYRTSISAAIGSIEIEHSQRPKPGRRMGPDPLWAEAPPDGSEDSVRLEAFSKWEPLLKAANPPVY